MGKRRKTTMGCRKKGTEEGEGAGRVERSKEKETEGNRGI